MPHHLQLRELRGFTGPDGELYVANAYQGASQVLRFAGGLDADGRHRFRAVYVAHHHANPGLAHPFAVTFGPDGHLFVPSQDTNVSGRYCGPQSEAGTPGAPMPLPPAVRAGDTTALLPGTFMPSHRYGLRAVRGTAFGADGPLYLVDRDAHSVKRFHGVTGPSFARIGTRT